MYGYYIVKDFNYFLTNMYLNFCTKDELVNEIEMYPYLVNKKEKGSLL